MIRAGPGTGRQVRRLRLAGSPAARAEPHHDAQCRAGPRAAGAGPGPGTGPGRVGHESPLRLDAEPAGRRNLTRPADRGPPAAAAVTSPGGPSGGRQRSRRRGGGRG